MFYLLDKPKGISSFKTISDFAQKKHIAKIGHSGTLDPLATGALLVATDDDTKLFKYISNNNKTYLVTFKLGYSSNTYDIDGELKKTSDKIATLDKVKKIVMTFKGKIKQIPPLFSAKKVDGKRSYELARQGIVADLKPVTVHIFSIRNFKKIKTNTFIFETEVSNGTYIRSLIHDIGIKINTGAIMINLRRIKIGDLELKQAVEKIDPFTIIKLEKMILNKKDVISLLDGKQVNVNKNNGIFSLVFNNQIIGIGKIKKGLLRSQKILGKKVQKVL